MVVERAAMPANRLLGVIETQTEIVRLGSDLAGVMSLVAGRALALTHAVEAVVELAAGDDMVYRATAGITAPHLGLRLSRSHSLSGLCVEEGRLLRMEATVGSPFEFEQHAIPLRTSIGVALYPDDGTTLEALLEAADQAMYAQKRSRSGTRC